MVKVQLQKWFKVQYSTDLVNNAQSLIMDVKGYSHIEFESQKKVYGAGHYYKVESAFIRATSITALRAELKHVFGYNFEKYLYNQIIPLYK